MNRMEYVGHLIDSDEMHFTRSKLDNIARFEGKHFLGFANDFHDHVLNFSVLATLLQKLVIGNTKSMRKKGETGGRRSRYLYPSEGFDRSFAEAILL
jgi:hypothetical protein